jgi:hypothetical protein
VSGVSSLKRQGSDNEEIVKLQDYIDEALGPILSNPLLNGVLLRNLNVQTGNNLIAHKLDRKPLGFFVIRKRANINVWDSQDTEKLPNRFFSLESSGNGSIDIIIF